MGKFAKQALVAAAVATAFVFLGPGALTLGGVTFGTTASIAILTGAQLALGALSQALAPKRTLPAQENRVQVRSGFASRKILYGRCASGGLLAFAHSWGTNNKELSMVSCHGVGECDGIESVHIGEKTVTFTGNDADGALNGFLKMWFYGGTTTQSADATLVANTSGKWTSAHQLKDICYTVLQFTYDKDKWPRGLPPAFAVIRGRKLYDPRLDNTYGSGSHDPNDPTTWSYSANPALAWLNYKLDPDYGCAVPFTRIDIPSVIAAANICDELVTLKAGGSHARYEIHGAIDTANRKADNIGAILSAMGGREVYTGGKFEVHAAAWATPTVTLTDDDLRGALQVTTRASRRERRNAVRGVYVDKDSLTLSDFPPRTNATWETEDNGERLWHDIELGWTDDHRRAQRLAKIDAELARREMVVNFPSKIVGYQLKAMDTVQVTNTRFGWSAKTFRVLEWALADDGGVDLVLKEEDSTVYAWTAATDELDRVARGTVAIRDAGALISPAGLVLAATSTTGTGGESIPAISVSWTASSDPFIERMVIEYRKTADSDWIRLEGADPAAGSALIPNVASGTGYTVRINYRSTTGVFGTWQTDTVTTAAGYTSGDASTVDGMEASLVRKGLPTAVRNGFEDFEFSDWTENSADGNTLDQDADAYVGAYAGLFTYTAGGDPVSSGDTGGAFLRIPKEIALGYGGRQIRVTVYAKQPASGASAEFAVAYSTADTGNSGWLRFTPTTSWAPYSFIMSVPAPAAGNDGYVGIWADTSNSGLGVLIDSVYVTPLTVEDELDALSLNNGPAEAGADVTGSNTAANITGQGALATANQADFATQVAGSEKPENNATNNTGALADADQADFATQVTGSEKPENNATNNTGALADLDAVTDDDIAGTIGLSADVLARKNTIANAYGSQHIIAENTEKNQATDSTVWVTACYFNPDMAGDYRFSVEIRNEAEPTFSQEPEIRIRQGTTVLDTMVIDFAGASSNWKWSHNESTALFLEASGINPADGPIEVQHRAGFKNSADKWTKVRGIRLYSDNPRKPYFTPGPSNFPEILQ